MAKGYYVFGFSVDEPIEFTGRGCRQRALKKAREIYEMGCDNVIVQHFDDDNPDGCLANEECFFIQDYKRG